MSEQLTLWDIVRFTSSPGSEVGALPPDLLGSLTTSRCGQAPHPVSHSRTPERSEESPMSGIYGQSCAISSLSAALQSSLENRLQVALASTGSPLYALTWRERAMRSGPPIYALRASARRTFANGSTGEESGWPTPVAAPAGGTPERFLERKQEWIARGSSMGLTISDIAMVAQLSAWPTPDASALNDGQSWESNQARRDRLKHKHGNSNGAGLTVAAAATACGWPTPLTTDGDTNQDLIVWETRRARKRAEGGRDQPKPLQIVAKMTDPALIGWPTPDASEARTGYQRRDTGMAGTQKNLGTVTIDGLGDRPHLPAHGPARFTSDGRILTGSCAVMVSGGRLNPAHSRWLMGFPPEWDDCAATATPLSRKSRRRS